MGVTYASVCSGIGLLDLAVRRVFRDARPVLYVEREAFCVEFLAQAMEDGRLDPAPISTDVRDVRGGEVPSVDLLFGGIPCQPFSQAGKQAQAEDDRDLVPEFLRLAGELGPSVCFVEEVSGFVSRDGIGRLLGGLADLGFDAEWSVLRARDVGAPHRRRRVFVLAYRDEPGLDMLRGCRVQHRDQEPWSDPDGCDQGMGEGPVCGEHVPDAECGAVRLVAERGGGGAQTALARHDELVDVGAEAWPAPWPPGPQDDAGWFGVLSQFPQLAPAELHLRGVANGGPIPRLDALRALGNAVVPKQAEAALWELIERALR